METAQGSDSNVGQQKSVYHKRYFVLETEIVKVGRKQPKQKSGKGSVDMEKL